MSHRIRMLVAVLAAALTLAGCDVVRDGVPPTPTAASSVAPTVAAPALPAPVADSAPYLEQGGQVRIVVVDTHGNIQNFNSIYTVTFNIPKDAGVVIYNYTQPVPYTSHWMTPYTIPLTWEYPIYSATVDVTVNDVPLGYALECQPLDKNGNPLAYVPVEALTDHATLTASCVTTGS